MSETVEVEAGANNMEVVNESHTEQVVELGMNQQVQEQIAPTHDLFDVDLERMNIDLYRGKYLTPDDFLEDIRKIVHNAYARINEDPERLFRAQAMLTAAEVSIQDFDPQFRLECQRMAGREKRRREQFRKEKEKEKQPIQNGTYAPGTRRSARNNGQEPEMLITDPVLLERRLKRQRSNGVETTPSEDENGERVAKKSRTEGQDAPASPLAAGGRSMSVRFADEVQAAAPGSSSPIGAPSSSPSGLEASGSGLDPPRRNGFDPALLNPMSPTDLRASVPMDPPDNPFSDPMPVISKEPTPQPVANGPNGLPSDAQIILDGDGDQRMDTSPTHELTDVTALASAPGPQPEQLMEIERSPTPPLPDFHLSEDLLGELKAYLRDETGSLNVEQLEQLRATCLGIVWRHRTEWDRDALLKELGAEARSFVEEVLLDDVDASSP